MALTFSATRRNLLDAELFAGRRDKKTARKQGGGKAGAQRARVMTPEELAAQIGSRLPGLVRELATAGAGAARAMTAGELAETVRVA